MEGCNKLLQVNASERKGTYVKRTAFVESLTKGYRKWA